MILEDLRGWMAGEDCLVVGTGPSAHKEHLGWVEGGYNSPYEFYGAHWTIACNRAAQLCAPDFALCVEPYRDRTVWEAITAASPLIVFTHLSETPSGRKAHPRVVKLGSKDVRAWLTPEDVICKSEALRANESAFFGAAIAVFLGFETIGLIGVDQSPDKFDDDRVRRSGIHWRNLYELAADVHGSRIINLSADSRLTVIPHGTWQDVRTKNTKRGAEWDKATTRKV